MRNKIISGHRLSEKQVCQSCIGGGTEELKLSENTKKSII